MKTEQNVQSSSDPRRLFTVTIDGGSASCTCTAMSPELWKLYPEQGRRMARVGGCVHIHFVRRLLAVR